MLGLCATLFGCLAGPVGLGPNAQLLIVAGVGGEEKYTKEFYDAGKQLVEAARTKYGIADSMITFLAEQPERDAANIRGPATAAEVEKAFAKIKARAKPGDLVMVVLIGHGSSQDRETSVFNLVGSPDMGAHDFNKLMTPLAKQEIVFVNAASASGDFVEKLAGKNRIVIASTMSPMERNYSKFSKFFVSAFGEKESEADTDKNGKVSILEAYNYARTGIAKSYKSAKLIQSEHSRLDDNGDGVGAPVVEYEGDVISLDLQWFPLDGRLAARTYLNGAVDENKDLTALYQERDDLVAKMLALRGKASSMDAATYERELQGILAGLVVATVRTRWLLNGGKSS